MGDLSQQLAIISQASSDLAAPLAAALIGAGARLAVVDANLEAAETLTVRLQAMGGHAFACEAVMSADSVGAALTAITADHGQPAVLVTCPPPPVVVCPSRDLSEADFRVVMENSLIHAFLWCQAVGRTMLTAGKGVIVNVTGLSGLGGWPGWLAHSAALAGVHNLTHTLAAEWSGRGVRVNCLVPGVTDATLAALLQTPQAPDQETVLERIPLRRLASPDDLGHALLYLVRPEASFISGEVLRVDGAWDVWGRYYAVDPRTRQATSGQ